MDQTLSNLLQNFSYWDGAGIILLLLGWWGGTAMIERTHAKRPSMHALMSAYRLEWMRQMLTRQPRIFDMATLTLMRQGTAFFASGCMIAIGGCVALLGSSEQLTVLAGDISAELISPRIVWEIKILVLMLLLANGFLKFVWAMRLFGYCAIVMAAAPNDPEDAQALPMAAKAGQLANTAAKSFNRGLRSVYFSIATLTWLIGSGAFIAATLITIWVLYRREYASQSRGIIDG